MAGALEWWPDDMTVEMTASADNLPELNQASLPVQGMTCGACAVRLEKALNRASGISDAAVNFAMERASVSFDPAETDVTQIADVVSNAGFHVGEETRSFGIGGMTCSACSTRIEKILNRLPGVVDATVNLAMERADVRAVGADVNETLLTTTLENAGFSAHFQADSESAE